MFVRQARRTTTRKGWTRPGDAGTDRPGNWRRDEAPNGASTVDLPAKLELVTAQGSAVAGLAYWTWKTDVNPLVLAAGDEPVFRKVFDFWVHLAETRVAGGGRDLAERSGCLHWGGRVHFHCT